MAVIVFMQYNKDSSIVRSQQEFGMDIMLNLTAGISIPENTTPYVLLDIDSKTYRLWQEPVVVPKDKLVSLIDFAIKGGAKTVIVDIDVSRTRGDDSEILREYFSDLESYLQESKSQYVFLMKTFKEKLSEESEFFRYQRESVLDDIVASSDYIHWASPLFEMAADLNVRRWRLAEKTCQNNRPVIVPSVQLLAYAIKIEQSSENIYKQFSAMLPHKCDDWVDQALSQPQLKIGDVSVNLENQRILKRIIYDFHWKLGDGYSYPKVTLQDDGGEVQVPVLSIIPAYLVSDSETSIDSSIIKKRNVIIGASFVDSRDIYLTPLGLMPGSLIVLNALNSLYSYGDIAPLNIVMLLFINVILIIGISVLYAYYSPLIASVTSAFITIVVVLPVSMLFFKEGVWLSFAAPLVTVQFIESIASVTRMVSCSRDKKDD